MKKKILFLLFTLLTVAVFAVGCAKAPNFGSYDDFTGINPKNHLEKDDYITIDGKLEEDVWADSMTAIDIEGATYDVTKQTPVDVDKYGERNAVVYTHIGEKALYFAFEVEDKNLYYNPYRGQWQNTCVEVYFSPANQSGFDYGCWSVRVNPVGNGSDEVNIGVYRPRHFRNVDGNAAYEWDQTNVGAAVEAACVIDGEIMTDASQFDYTTENNVGYVIEIAIDIDLLGDEIRNAVQYTAAFCQARNFNEDRINNTFITGTSYLNPATWILVTNDGIIEDKETFLDAQIVADEGVEIDGIIDDVIWDDTQARRLQTSLNRSGKSGETEKLYYDFRSVTTDKGIYVGIESNDAYVYYSGAASKNKNTGVELAITVDKGTVVSPDDTIMYWFNVGGSGERRRATDVANQPEGTWAYGDVTYYPLKAAGYVDGEMNTNTANGWSGEIFIPWSVFGDVTYRDGVAIMIAGYRSTDLASASYLAPYDRTVFAGGAANMNPQERWFVFENGKPLYDLNISDITLDGRDLNAGGDYEKTLEIKYSDNVVRDSAYEEKFPEVLGGEFESSADVGFEELGEGEYTIYVPKNNADAFEEAQRVVFKVGNRNVDFSLTIDSEFALDGILDEDIYYDLNKLTTSQTTNNVTVTNIFTVALRERAMYLHSIISDANYDAQKNSSGLGMELYFNFGNEINPSNTYQIRIQSNADAVMCNYVPGSASWPWSSDFPCSGVESVYVNNNDGTYNLEVKIPYSVFGLSEKPDTVNVAPFTRFWANGRVSTKLEKWEGGGYTDDFVLYHSFGEFGFEPEKAILYNVNGVEVDSVKFVRDIEMQGNDYVGLFSITLYPEMYVPVTDATFGEFDQYFTINGGGSYTVSVPATEFVDDELTVPVISRATGLVTTITLRLDDLTSAYLEPTSGYKTGEGKVNLYAFDAVNRSDVDYYVAKFKAYSDASKSFGLDASVIDGLDVSIDNVDGIVTETEGNEYIVYVPVSAVTSGEDYTIQFKLDSKLLANNLSYGFVPFDEEDVKQAYVDNAQLYINFDDNGYANTLNNGVKTYFEWGAGDVSRVDGIYTMNQAERALNASNVTLGDQFTLSLMVNGDDVLKTWSGHFANMLFGTGNVDANYGYDTGNTVPFGIFVRSNYLAVEIDNRWGGTGINFTSCLTAENIGGWRRWTFTIDRTNVAGAATDTVTVKFYVDGKLLGSKNTVIEATHDFNNVDNIVGIGAPAKYYDGLAEWLSNGKPLWYVDTNNGDQSANHNIRLDNILLLDGIMDVEEMNMINAADRLIQKPAAAVSQEVINDLKNNSQLYVNFDGDGYDNKLGSAQTYFEWGAGDVSRVDGIYTSNQAERALNASNVTLGDQFTLSLMVNGDDVLKTWGGGYMRTLFSTGNVDGFTGYSTNQYVGFGIYFHNTKLFVQMEDYAWNNVSIDMSEVILQKIGGWQRWTFTVDRIKGAAEDVVQVKLYVDGILASTKSTTVATTHSFNNVDNIVGIGAPAKYHDITNPQGVDGEGKPFWYIASGAQSAHYNIRLDNVMLYNGIMSVEAMTAIDVCDAQLVAQQ